MSSNQNLRIQIQNDRVPPATIDQRPSTSRATDPGPSHMRSTVTRIVSNTEEDQSLKVEQFYGPRKFYDIVTSMAVSYSEDQPNSVIGLTDIPNVLKVIEDKRKIILSYLANAAMYPLKEIIHQEVNSTLYIHVGRGSGELLVKRRRQEEIGINLMARTSYKFPQYMVENTTIILKCRGQLTVAIEVLDPLPDETPYHPKDTMPKYLVKIPEAARTYKIAMLRNPKMSDHQIRERLIFIDVECAHGLENQPIPISIAALDYDGRVLMNQKICPRAYINRYEEFIHGLRERDLIGKEDSVETLRKVTQMLRGKIIVGHDLHMEHVALNIDLDSLAGIRDLQGSRAVARKMKDGRNSWKLGEVAIRLNAGRQSKIHTAIEDVRLIRNIYRTIEGIWEDNSKEEIETLYNRTCSTKLAITRTRLQYSTDIRKERKEEDNIQPMEDDEENKISESTRSVMVPEENVEIHDLTLSPDVSIADEIYLTPPTSPMKVDTPVTEFPSIESTDLFRKKTLPNKPVVMDSSSEDELLEVRSEFHFISKKRKWSVMGQSIKLSDLRPMPASTRPSKKPKKTSVPHLQ